VVEAARLTALNLSSNEYVANGVLGVFAGCSVAIIFALRCHGASPNPTSGVLGQATIVDKPDK